LERRAARHGASPNGYQLRVQGDLYIHASQADERHRLRVVGTLDIETAGDLEDAVKQACAKGAQELTLDLRELTFLDSSGIRAILVGRESCERHGCEYFLIRSTNHMLHRIIVMAGQGRLQFKELAESDEGVAELGLHR
jgi:anti-anti-sigma factor